MTDKYVVFGNPIAHSKSPLIHTMFARQTGQDLSYDRQLVAAGSFVTAARRFLEDGGQGLNITVPFKLDAFQFADELTARARDAGAVNTLYPLPDRKVGGDNTDGIGLLRDLVDNLGWAVAGMRVLVLGAGGAVRGVLGPLLDAGAGSILIANRTPDKAGQLADGFAGRGSIAGCGFEALAGQQFDLVINGTSASIGGDLPPLPEKVLAPGACCYDMMYQAEPTVFMRWAEEHGAAATADGLGMLVEQAAESFSIWRGLMPETGPVIDALRRG